MKLSNYFLPTLKENPIDAKVVSHQLMMRSGMIRQTSLGIYTWLPLGLKVLRKVENIIRNKMNEAGAIELLMPVIQPAELWQESNRYDSYGKEMLRIKDRHERDMLFGPTHEEVITDIFRKNINSYKDLPKNLYQINTKFRDEIRPRFGVMRSREFMMKDGYSFDINEEKAKETYNLMYETYFQIFYAMGLKPIAVRADNGAIGGSMSHEFHILAKTGESAIYYDKQFDSLSTKEKFDIKKMQSLYAMADEMHDENNCPVSLENLASKRGIEVGHIFNFGTKYSKSMNASVMGNAEQGSPYLGGESERVGGAMGVHNKIYPNMGSYGIGVSRIVASAIEANFDEKGIVWTKELSPFDVYLINVKNGDEVSDKICDEIYAKLRMQNIDVLYDDRKVSLGQKFSTADLIGIPTQVIVGSKLAKENKIEVKNRQTGEKQEILIENLSKILDV